MAEDRPRKATKTKARFGEVVARVGKDEADAITEAEKEPYAGKKRGREATKKREPSPGR